jgi:hypothetical protein
MVNIILCFIRNNFYLFAVSFFTTPTTIRPLTKWSDNGRAINKLLITHNF